MPITLQSVNESRDPHTDDVADLKLFDESGGLTVAGEVYAQFLEAADFSALFEHPEAAPFVITVVDEDDEDFAEDVLPGEVVARLVDENDLDSMFLYYLDALGKSAIAEDAPISTKLQLAVFENALLAPHGMKYRPGAFKNLAEGQRGVIKKMPRAGQRAAMTALLVKGVFKDSKRKKAPGKSKLESVNEEDGPMPYQKGARYPDGTGAGKALWGKIQKSDKSGIERGKKSSARKQSNKKLANIKRGGGKKVTSKGKGKRSRALAASVGMEEGFDFGFGESFGGANFVASAAPDAKLNFTEGELSELVQRFAPYYDDLGVAGAEANESTEYIGGRTSPMPIGRADISEGASIAARVIGRTQQLNEAKS